MERLLSILALLIAGCAITGTGTGLSDDAETQLRSLGPDINHEFDLAGSSLEIESGKRLTILVRDDTFAALEGSEQEHRSRSIATWIWDHGGKNAGVSAITVAPVGENQSDTKSVPFRFMASDLDRATVPGAEH